MLQLVLVAAAGGRDGAGGVWRDTDGYEERCCVLAPAQARERITEVSALPFLDLV